MTMETILVNVGDVTHVRPSSQIYMLQKISLFSLYMKTQALKGTWALLIDQSQNITFWNLRIWLYINWEPIDLLMWFSTPPPKKKEECLIRDLLLFKYPYNWKKLLLLLKWEIQKRKITRTTYALEKEQFFVCLRSCGHAAVAGKKTRCSVW